MSYNTADDDYDDSPLFTRESSYKYIRHICSKTVTRSECNAPQEFIKYRISCLESNLLATILEDAIMQLRVIDECNKHLSIYKMQSDMQALCRGKYGVIMKKDDSQKPLNHLHLQYEYHKLDKLIRDRTFCKDVLTSTYIELALKSSYAPLVETIIIHQQREQNYDLLIENEAQNKTTRREISKMLRQQRNRMKSAVYENNGILDRLLNQVEDATLINEIKERYITKWEQSRSEQNAWHLQKMEIESSEALQVYRQKIEDEKRVHNELILHNGIRLNDILQSIESWMAKFDKDMETIDLKIQIKKIDYEAQIETRYELEQRITEHKEALKKWAKHKEECEKRRQYNIKMTKAATTVQAWWRGLLVRLELGPYKRKKRPLSKIRKKQK